MLPIIKSASAALPVFEFSIIENDIWSLLSASADACDIAMTTQSLLFAISLAPVYIARSFSSVLANVP